MAAGRHAEGSHTVGVGRVGGGGGEEGSQGPYLYCNWKLEHLQSIYDVRYEISRSGTTLCVFIHLISKHITTLCNCVVQATRQHRPGIKTTPPLYTREIVMN